MTLDTHRTNNIRITIPIYGVTCWGDAAHTIEHALSMVDGVRNVYVNPAMEMAYVQFNGAECSTLVLAEAIQKMGFHPGEASFR